jgi:hypothetical protein
MGKKELLKFYTHVKREGSQGATRGKVPVALCTAVGAGDGDIIEWEVQGGVIVGGHTLSKSERKEYLADQKEEARERQKARTPAKKARKESAPSKPKVKGKVKSDKAVVKSKKGKKSRDEEPTPKKKGKTSKRRTEVEYESEPRPKKKGKLKLGKKK